MTRLSQTTLGLIIGLPLLAFPLASAQAQDAREAKPSGQASEADEAERKGGWDGQLSVAAVYSKRTIDQANDFNRSGLAAYAQLGLEEPLGETTTVRIEARAETDKYTTSVGAEVELQQELGSGLTASLSAGAVEDDVFLESVQADQLMVRAGLTLVAGNTTVEVYGRHRWRDYEDTTGGEGEGWQLGGRLRQRIGPYHWVQISGYRDRIDDGLGRHGYERTALSFDYSQPIVGRHLRLVLGLDYRNWTFDGRWVGDVSTNPRRQDQLYRPEIGLVWGKSEGLFVRATVGYDFHPSNDPRYDGDGARARLVLGYRF